MTAIVAPGACGVSSTAEAADYEALMREGIALRRAGNDLAALKRFQEAYAIEKTPKVLVQIGLAEQALGRWGSADRHVRKALESADDPWVRRNRATIDASLSVIAEHIGQLDVRGIPDGAEVRVDGELVGQLPLPGPVVVTASGVAIEVRAPGYVVIVRATTVKPRTLTRETFNLQPSAPVGDQGSAGPSRPGAGPGSRSSSAEPAGSTSALALDDARAEPERAERSARSPDSASEPAAGGPWRMLALGAGGLAVAALAVGVVEHLTWQRKASSFGLSTSGCGVDLPDDGKPGCKQLYEDGQRARTLAFVGYGLTAAFGVAAVVLYLISPGRRAEPRKVACGPIPSLTAPGLDCTLRF